MFWRIIGLLIMLGIGTPILMRVYDGFVNSQNGTWIVDWYMSNSTSSTPAGTYTVNTTMYYPYELGIFQFIPLLCVLGILAFLAILISGRFEKKEGQM